MAQHGRWAAVLFCGVAAAMRVARVSEVQEGGEKPLPALKIMPFSKIADEIHEAELAAEDLKYEVSNSTAEKASIQWFMATAMKELTSLQKVVLNASVEGSLGYAYEGCMNLTTAKFPTWNQSLTMSQAIKKDGGLAPDMVEARMYELYELQEEAKKLTMELGRCSADCGSLLQKGRSASRMVEEQPAPAPAPAPGGGDAAGPPPPPSASELMRSVANAIYNTSASIDQMKATLVKDASAKQVLGRLSGLVMERLMKAKKSVDQMEKDLKVCEHTPLATRLDGPVAEAMAANSEVSMELVKQAEGETTTQANTVKALQAKLNACKKRCGE